MSLLHLGNATAGALYKNKAFTTLNVSSTNNCSIKFLSNGNLLFSYAYYVVCVDSFGNKIWAKLLPSSICATTIDTSDNIYIVGTNHNGTNYETHIYKFDINGNNLITKKYKQTGIDIIADGIMCVNNYIYILYRTSTMRYLLKMDSGLSTLVFSQMAANSENTYYAGDIIGEDANYIYILHQSAQYDVFLICYWKNTGTTFSNNSFLFGTSNGNNTCGVFSKYNSFCYVVSSKNKITKCKYGNTTISKTINVTGFTFNSMTTSIVCDTLGYVYVALSDSAGNSIVLVKLDSNLTSILKAIRIDNVAIAYTSLGIDNKMNIDAFDNISLSYVQTNYTPHTHRFLILDKDLSKISSVASISNPITDIMSITTLGTTTEPTVSSFMSSGTTTAPTSTTVTISDYTPSLTVTVL